MLNFQEFGYFEQVIVFIIINYLFETYLDFRQWRRTFQSQPESSKEFEPDEERYKKAQEYSRAKLGFGLATDWIGISQELVILLFRLYPLLWTFTREHVQSWLSSLGEDSFLASHGEFIHLIAFFFAGFLIDLVISTPLSAYRTFVIEERFGTNRTTLSTFVTDILKSIVLTFVFTCILLYPITWILSFGSSEVWMYLWAFIVVFALFLLTIKPIVIDPLFNTYTPLPSGELRSRIEALAKRLNFPLTQLFQVDGSRRSSHSNAYFYGIFSKRIVLFDTLLNLVSVEEAEAVLGHELGHWALSHTIYNICIAQAYFGGFLYIASKMIYDVEIFHSFGFLQDHPPIIGLYLFSKIFSPIDSLMSFLMNALSRKFEYQADAFAVKLGFGTSLASGLIKMTQDNLGNLNPDPLYVIYHYSHPSVPERVAAIRSQKND